MLPIVGTRNIWIWLKASAEAAAVCTAPLVALNRKVLADLAVRQKEDFAKLVELAKTKLA